MTRRLRLAMAALILPLILAACGTPQERCIRNNTGEYRSLQALLTETEANLARGYAWRERNVVRSEFTTCRRPVRAEDGGIVYAEYGCWRDVTDVERYRVPIDPASETRKRDNLAAKLKAEAPRARLAVDQCKAAYPET